MRLFFGCLLSASPSQKKEEREKKLHFKAGSDPEIVRFEAFFEVNVPAFLFDEFRPERKRKKKKKETKNRKTRNEKKKKIQDRVKEKDKEKSGLSPVEYIFIQNPFHAKNTLIQTRAHPKTSSSERTFVRRGCPEGEVGTRRVGPEGWREEGGGGAKGGWAEMWLLFPLPSFFYLSVGLFVESWPWVAAKDHPNCAPHRPLCWTGLSGTGRFGLALTGVAYKGLLQLAQLGWLCQKKRLAQLGVGLAGPRPSWRHCSCFGEKHEMIASIARSQRNKPSQLKTNQSNQAHCHHCLPTGRPPQTSKTLCAAARHRQHSTQPLGHERGEPQRGRRFACARNCQFPCK